MTSEVPYSRIFNRDPKRVAQAIPDAMVPVARDKAASEIHIRKGKREKGTALTRADFGLGFDQVARGSDVAKVRADIKRDLFTLVIENLTDENNLAATGGFVAGTSQISGTFTAPSSGKIEVIPFFRANADTFTPTLFAVFGFEIRETDVSGTVIYTADTEHSATIIWDVSPSANNDTSHNHDIVDILTPGKVYFIRGLYSISGGTTIDITYRKLIVKGMTA